MHLSFKGKIWYWRGPAPYYFVSVPEQQSDDIKAISKLVTYGWGVIPVYDIYTLDTLRRYVVALGDQFELEVKIKIKSSKSSPIVAYSS